VANLDVSLKDAMDIEGAIGVALVDHTSGMTLGTAGGSTELDLNIAAAGNTDVVRAKLRTLELLNMSEGIEDVIITLHSQYHLIRPLTSRSGKSLFLYLVLAKNRANLGLARYQLRQIEERLEL
jgi:predicted regulator of Ras-like GTPase activity (Roadblock/LC7/MglB family)